MTVRTRTRTALALGVITVIGMTATGCGAATADAEDASPEHKAFPVAGKRLGIETDNAPVELVPAKDGRADVGVTRWFSSWTLGGSARASWEMEDGTLKLRSHCSGIANCSAKYRIEVPRGVELSVRDGNGAVTAKGFETALRIRSQNGRVEVTDSTGDLDLRSANGEVIATGTGSRRVKAGSGNGTVRLAFARVPERVETDNDNGATRITVPKGTYKVDVRSGNGSTQVDVPRDSASPHSITARSDNGSVRVSPAD
ncbi:DUF4097 family beta strand repeat-containing protein [Streptomyces gamaensis]|uniref:DUF4097 family beta strand repeat-containing protein n=1 Tax=Streptomyces gamaensis TaxID=1763542 RepID=A0ABW0YZ13_9ACTN